MRTVTLIGLLLCNFSICLSGQWTQLRMNRTKLVLAQTDAPLWVDTLTILPSSLIVTTLQGDTLDSTLFEVKNAAIWLKSPLGSDSLKVHYRVLSQNLGAPYARRDSTQLAPAENNEYIGFDYTPTTPQNNLIEMDGLDYRGNFTRGISFGNNQNLVLNSNFNLQLNGTLAEEIEIQAAISDNNIPVQAEGNTQQLQEFDRIYIQLKKDQTQLTAGDYEISRPRGYFLNYFKKLQGATFSNTSSAGANKSWTNTASFAVARGKFSRNVILGQEGNQGPYRLTGAEGEAFIIVLSGTEKVYLDGVRLTRGLEHDYIIDYNRGDVTFTDKRLITKDSRIIVEFEYAQRQFLRSLIAVNSLYESPKWTIYLNGLSEQDNKNSGEVQTLTDAQKMAISQAGDATGNILAPGDREALPADPVNYVKINNPSPCAVPFDSIFVQVEGGNEQDLCPLPALIDSLTLLEADPLLSVSFSQVGLGQGNYIRCPEAFGTVFVFSPPDENCQPTGDYEPVVRLTAPQQQQIISGGASYHPDKGTSIEGEWALSQRDLNRFSTSDDRDNTGLAFRLKAAKELPLHKKNTAWAIRTEAAFEFVQDRFTYISPFRNPEFARDWNQPVQANSPTQNEQLGSGKALIMLGKGSQIGYGLDYFKRDSSFEGIRHNGFGSVSGKGFLLAWKGSLMTSRSPAEHTFFLRPQASWTQDLYKPMGLQFFARWEMEDNRRSLPQSDSLLSTSFQFDIIEARLSTPATKTFNWSLAWRKRWDQLPTAQGLVEAALADEYLFSGSWRQGQSSLLKWNFTRRELQVFQDSLVMQAPEKSNLGRIDYQLNLLNRFLSSNLSYIIGSGQERRVEYIYREVQPGEEGTHFWNKDADDDGIIQFDEVELPPFPDAANLVRIIQLTDDFIETDQLQLNASLRASLAPLLRKKGGFRNTLKKLSFQSILSLQRKTLKDPLVQAWNPLQQDVPDTLVSSIAQNFRAELFFNRADPVYDVKAGVFRSQRKEAVTSVFELRDQEEFYLEGRWNIQRKWSITLRLSELARNQDSEFASRDFQIRTTALLPQITYQPGANQSFRLRGSWADSRNIEEGGGEQLNRLELALGASVAKAGSATFRMEFQVTQIQFVGASNTPVSFALLEGLQPGANYLWNLSLDQQLSRTLLLSIGYEGRKTGNNRVVHIGRAQVSAIF